ARVPQPICFVGVAALRRAGLFYCSVGFRSGEARPATLIQARARQFALPRGMPDGDGRKNVYSQERFLKRISPRPSRAPRCAKREMEGDLPFLLLFHASPKAPEVQQRTVHGVSQIRGYASVRRGHASARRPPAQWHADMTVGANPNAHSEPIR